MACYFSHPQFSSFPSRFSMSRTCAGWRADGWKFNLGKRRRFSHKQDVPKNENVVGVVGLGVEKSEGWWLGCLCGKSLTNRSNRCGRHLQACSAQTPRCQGMEDLFLLAINSPNPVKGKAGRLGAVKRWGAEPRIVRLDELNPSQRRLVVALIAAARQEAAPVVVTPGAADAEGHGDDRSAA